MTKAKVLDKRPLNLSEVKAHLGKIKKRDEELNFRSAKTEEYLNNFARLTQRKSKELYDKLSELGISRLRDEHFQKLVDLTPTTASELKSILQAYSITLESALNQKIVDTITEVIR